MKRRFGRFQIMSHHSVNAWVWSINSGRRVVMVSLRKRWNDLWCDDAGSYLTRFRHRTSPAGNRVFQICMYLLNVLISDPIR